MKNKKEEKKEEPKESEEELKELMGDDWQKPEEEKKEEPKPQPPKEEEDDGIEEVDETEEEPQEEDATEESVKKLKTILENLQKKSGEEGRRFGRVENKQDFSAEVINTKSNQKVANLEFGEISDLLKKRSFMNFVNAYGWKIVGDMAHKTIQDVENYSLSKDGFLIKHTLIEQAKQALFNYENKKMKGGPNQVNV